MQTVPAAVSLLVLRDNLETGLLAGAARNMAAHARTDLYRTAHAA